MTSPLLGLSGAVPADGPDAGVAAHYGDPVAEQRAMSGQLALVDRSHRGVVRVAGPDRLSWLHSLSTQHLEQFAVGATAQTLVLSPNGHVEHHLTLTDDGTATWIHLEPGTAPSLVEFLDSMRFMLRVEAADASEEYAVLTLAGPAARRDTAPEAAVAVTANTFGHDVVVPRARIAAVAADLRGRGARMAGTWAHTALRIAAHEPRFGLDTDHRTIPHEVGWIDTAVHLAKGCYRGQETVARVQNLGHPPRRLVFLHLDGSVDRLPGHGSPVVLARTGDTPAADAAAADESDGAKQVGFVGSSARHFDLGPIALALVRRTVPTQATLLADGIAAAQEVIVAPDAGASVRVDRAAFPRR